MEKNELKAKKVINFIGMLIGITSLVLACIIYDWKLAAIIFLALMGNNLEQHK